MFRRKTIYCDQPRDEQYAAARVNFVIVFVMLSFYAGVLDLLRSRKR